MERLLPSILADDGARYLNPERERRNGIASVASFLLANFQPFLEAVGDGDDFPLESGLSFGTGAEFSRNSRASLRVSNVL